MSYDNFMTCLTTCLPTMFVNRAPGLFSRGVMYAALKIGSQNLYRRLQGRF